MRLNHLTNKILLSDTKRLVDSERKALTTLLYHLNEIEKRKLYSDLKCSSLFHYCIQELGYSESSAQRRIVAARTLREIPEIGPKINDGRLTLTNIALVNQFIKGNKKEVLKEIEGLTKNQCEKRLFEITGKKEEPREGKRRISKDEMQITVILTDETLEEIQKLKDLLGKELSMDELLRFMAKESIKSVEKKKFKQQSLSPAKVGTDRAIPAGIKRDVYARDKACVRARIKAGLSAPPG